MKPKSLNDISMILLNICYVEKKDKRTNKYYLKFLSMSSYRVKNINKINDNFLLVHQDH